MSLHQLRKRFDESFLTEWNYFVEQEREEEEDVTWKLMLRWRRCTQIYIFSPASKKPRKFKLQITLKQSISKVFTFPKFLLLARFTLACCESSKSRVIFMLRFLPAIKHRHFRASKWLLLLLLSFLHPATEIAEEKGKQQIIKNNIIASGCNRKRLYVAHFHSYLA